MAAIIAVTLLLLCGSVYSAQEEALTGYVTQVRTGESNTSLTTVAASPDMAQAITTPTEESGETHSAVLSSSSQNVKSDVVLVDLARADDEQMNNMTLGEAPADAPSAEEATAEGFDMTEEEEDVPSTAAEAPRSDSSDPDAALPADEAQEQGSLVSDVDDTNYPNLPDTEDYSTGQGYGVQPETSDDEAQGASFAASGEESSEGTQGTLVSDVDDTNYPNLPETEDFSTGQGYGVQPETSDDEAQGASFAASGEESSEGTQGTLVSDVDDTNYPNLPETEDFSTGQGYGVQPETSDDEAQGASFAASGEESSEGTQGTLVSDVDDTNYPNLPETEDYSTGQGYGVQPETSDDEAQGASFAASGEESSEETQGTLVSDVDDTNYPNLPETEDYSTGQGYGVQPETSDDEAQGASFAASGEEMSDDEAEGFSFAAYGEESSDGTQGTLVSDVDDTNYPNLPETEDYSTGQGYGVQPETSDDETQGASFAASGEESSEGTQGTLVSDVDDTNYPNLPETEDYSTGNGYGVGGEDAAITHSAAGSESETSAVTFRATNPPPPKPMASWGKGKCTFYGGMDASGTMSGACGYGNLYASGYGAYTAALSSALFKNGMACGACYEVACSGNSKSCKPGSVLVTVTNFCPPQPGQSDTNGGWCNGANKHFDLSYPAFAKIADPKAGVVDLNYRRVPCKKNGGIRYTLNGNCNFNLVTITNVGGSGVVTAVYMKADGLAWAPLTRNWGANWQCIRNYCGKGISIKIVTSDGKVSVSRLAGKDWAFGKTYIGKQVK